MCAQIVIVGASMSGLRAAEQLRAQGFDGTITVIGAEAHMPYNRPPLSKDVLARHRDETNSDLASWHQTVAFRRRKNTADVSWQLGQPVVASDLSARKLTLANGASLAFDGLVIATGLRPRRLDLAGPTRGRHVLRSLDDAIALRAELLPGTTVVVAGGGFIGCEIAATARKLDCTVHIVEPQETLMVRPLGLQLGRELQRVHEANRVTVHPGVAVESLIATASDLQRLAGVVLTDGTVLNADVLIESVGSRPNTEWLNANDLDLDDGVLCDNHLRVVSQDAVVAVGDIARFPDRGPTGPLRRVEHWCTAGDTAKRAAKTLIADLARRPDDDDVFCPLPAFWSDQYDLRLQGYGSPSDADSTRVLAGSISGRGSNHPQPGTAVGYYRADELVGAVVISPTAAQNMHYRNAVNTVRCAVHVN